MLWKRVLTAVVLLPIVIFAIFASTDHVFALLMSAVFAYAAWEWANLALIKKTICRLGYVITIIVLMWLSTFVQSIVIFSAALVFWIVVSRVLLPA